MKLPRSIVATLALLCVALLYVPMLAVAVFSVNQSKIGTVWRGFTLSWYTRLLSNQDVQDAAWNTLILAVVSTAIATVLGTMMAIGLGRFPWPKPVRAAFDATVYLPVVTPDIIFAAAMVVIFRVLRELTGWFDLGLSTMVIAHVTFQVAFVTLVVRGRLAVSGQDVEEAARDLYASTFYLHRKVMLPLLAPGIVAGALLAFTLSLDDFVISFFTSGTDSTTLPIYIYSSVKRGVSPELHALSTLIFLATVVLVVALQAFSHRPSSGGSR